MMSKHLEQALLSMGWFPGRKVETVAWMKTYESYGYTVVPDALRILEEFGGLTLRPIISGDDKFYGNTYVFDPEQAACTVCDVFDAWQQYLGVNLTPVAESLGGLGALIASEDSRMFISIDGLLRLCGSSFIDALENTIVFPRRMTVDLVDVFKDT